MVFSYISHLLNYIVVNTGNELHLVHDFELFVLFFRLGVMMNRIDMFVAFYNFAQVKVRLNIAFDS